MPIPTPFHERTHSLCSSLFYKDWAGYYTVCSYDTCHEREYYALRNAAGLIDVSPLYKYEVYGPGAADLLSRVMVRDVKRKLKVGRVTYLCWCDDDGKVVDDGTVSRLDDEYYRVTAAEPTLHWLHKYARPFNVTIEDSSRRFGALAVQGPNAREILRPLVDADLDELKFFGLTETTLDGVEVVITRTGYTGDLGYEVWVEAADAVRVYDAILESGRPWRVQPAGMDAMDVTRVEAGFIMNGVDYFSANHVLLDTRKSTPYELGLGWTVDLDREPFVGQRALVREKAEGSQWALVGLVVDWDEYEQLFAGYDLPPHVSSTAWRDPRPVYDGRGRQVGQATSGAWSPVLKKNLALATVQAPYSQPGTRLKLEVTVEYRRESVSATVTRTPFFNPERKRK